MEKITYHAVRLLAKYASPLFSSIERMSLSKNKLKKKHPIFIVGAPRTGSTLLYQLVTNNNEVLYINNFVNLFHRNLETGFLLNSYLFDNQLHNSFASDLGNTLKYGWKSPSESGNFWYNWLDKNNNYDANNNLNESKVFSLQHLFNRIMARHKKPLVFKNLNNSQRLPLIHQLDPQSRIIWIKRDPRYVAQSIIQARRRLNIKTDAVWSVNPKGLQPELYQNEYELVVHQIHLIEKQIKNDLQLFSPQNILEVNYTSMASNLKKILQFCGIKSEPSKAMIDQIRLSNDRTLSAVEWEKIEKEIKKLS